MSQLEARPPTTTENEICGDEILRRPNAWDFVRHSAREIAGEMVRFAFGAGASDLLLDDQEEWMDVGARS